MEFLFPRRVKKEGLMDVLPCSKEILCPYGVFLTRGADGVDLRHLVQACPATKEAMASKIRGLFDRNEWVFLSTINLAGAPESRAMLNLRYSKDFPRLQKYFENNLQLYFITHTSSNKVRHIRQRSDISVYCLEMGSAEAALLVGRAEEVSEVAVKEDVWHKEWEQYYPSGKDGGDYTLLRFSPSHYKYYNGALGVSEGGL